MSVTANDRFKSTTGDGVTTTFDIDFPFADSSEVAVATVVDGVKTVLGSGYSITPTAKTYPSDMAYPGGTITFTTAPASGTIIQRYGITAQTQATTISPNATLFSSAVQNIVDKLTWLYQEAKRDLGFTVQVTPGTSQVTIPPISDGPGYVYTDGTNPYELVNELDSGSLVVSGDTAGYVPFWSGSATLTALINFFYVTATKTLRLRGSATAADNILLLQDSAAATLATFRADGVETATTDLTRKAYVDTASGNAAVLAKLLTGFVAAEGTVAATDTILQAFNKIVGNYLLGTSRTLARTTGFVTISNSAAQTDVLSFTLAGGTLGTNRAVRIKFYGKYETNSVSRDATIRMKLGATTIISEVLTGIDVGTSNPKGFVLEFILRNINSASVQYGALSGVYESPVGTNNPVMDIGSGAENTATDKTLAVTWEWSAASSGTIANIAAEAELI